MMNRQFFQWAMGLNILFLCNVAVAQNHNYGETPEDSLKCIENYSLYTEFFKQNSYKDAYNSWNKTIQYCPKLSKSLYQNGAKILTNLIENESDEAKKLVLIDELLVLHDKRIEHYGQEGYVRGRKGTMALMYKPDEPKLAFEDLKKSFELQQNKTEASVLISLYKALYLMNRKDEATKEELLEWYPKLVKVANYNINNLDSEKKQDSYESARDNLDKIFAPLASCEDLSAIFTPKFVATPDDQELLKTIVELMGQKGCEEDELFLNAATKLHQLNPTAESAYSLGLTLKSNCGKAVDYFKEAAELSKENEFKIKSYLKASVCYLNIGQYNSARTYAQKALAINANLGDAYLIIGSAYAAGSAQCGDNDCSKKAGYWAAVDQFQKAKNVDAAVSEEANKKIALYSKHFPDKEKCFFHGINEGTSFEVGGWIGVSTTVRFSNYN